MNDIQVRLIGVTEPTGSTDCDYVGELVAWVARVSNPSNQGNKTTAAKLLKYLAEHNHWSPFEMVHMSIEVRTTRDIARQILRHRSFSFQEYSQRYANPTKDLKFVLREARLQDPKNRQNSIEVVDPELEAQWRREQQAVINVARDAYTWAIDNGIAKEQARCVLPEGNTESVVIMAGTLRSWIHYCQLRMEAATQKEHRIIAEQCWEIVGEIFPDLVEALS